MKDLLKAWDSRKKYKNYFRDDESGVDCYYEIDNRGLKIYIEPTNELIDWKTNLIFFKPIKDCINLTQTKLHYGYCAAAGCVYNHLMKKNVFNNLNFVYITSYSMGSGISPILAYNISLIVDCVVECYAFEGARIISKKFNTPSNLKIYNIENGNDTVTKLPLGWTKIGEIIHIGKPRKWYKTGIKFAYNKDKKGIRKFFDVPEHHYGSVKKSLENL